MKDPRPGMSSIPVAARSSNTTLPSVQAVPSSETEEDLLPVHDCSPSRVKALHEELRLLLKERKELADIAHARHIRCSELLEEARTAKRLTRAYLKSEGVDYEDERELDAAAKESETSQELVALARWAATTL